MSIFSIKHPLIIKTISLIFAVVLLAIMLLQFSSNESVGRLAKFPKQPFSLAEFGLFDMGIADINDDLYLDIYTVNHSGTQSLLVNQSGKGFVESFNSMDLDQDPSFPGLVVSPDKPEFDKPGLYIYWHGPKLVVEAYSLVRSEPVKGSIELLSPTEDHADPVVKFSKRETALDHGINKTSISFTFEKDGVFAIKPLLHALPIQFDIDKKVEPESIFIGHKHIAPDFNFFSINMRDRHGMSWADLTNDGNTDLLITRGGQRGWMVRMDENYWDELFISDGNKFHETGKSASLLKDGCSGRKIALVDYNNDNNLEFYIVCGKGRSYQPNKLFAQQADGTYFDIASQVGLDIGQDGNFIWTDADADGDLDMFWVDHQSFYIYQNQSGHFEKFHLGTNPAQRVSEKLTIADFDNDGDFDIFSASPGGNVLCINTGSTYAITNPVQWGLPAKSAVANWVDYDNDGLKDIHFIPNGIYRNLGNGRFKRTSILSLQENKYSSRRLYKSRVSWFDIDNDGTRDAVIAMEFGLNQGFPASILARLNGDSNRLGGLRSFWEAGLYRNDHTVNNWLQIDVTGPPGNKPGIGAKVTVETSNFIQVQQVGENEGARYSQGHYRLYFGLGKMHEIKSITVDWPDGRAQSIQSQQPNQLITIDWVNADSAV
ncbi:MAG: CRTAC1 family protein [Gammaproteobacteria bacterium]